MIPRKELKREGFEEFDSKTVSSININSMIYRTNVEHSCKLMNQRGPIGGEGGLVIPYPLTYLSSYPLSLKHLTGPQ